MGHGSFENKARATMLSMHGVLAMSSALSAVHAELGSPTKLPALRDCRVQKPCQAFRGITSKASSFPAIPSTL
eukprot:223751-Pelagomonas_calceolata.AAC.2